MLNIRELKKTEKRYREAKEAYLVNIKEWELRAREICLVYYALTGEGEIYATDKVTLDFSEDTVEIIVTDFEQDEIADYVVSMEDFIADDYHYRLKEKYEKKKQQEEEKAKKDLEVAERAELERLKAKYGE